MPKLKTAILLAAIFGLVSCGGTKKDEIDLATITDQELLEKSRTALQQGDYKRAVELDSLLLTNFPTSNLHIEAQLNMAEAYGYLEKWEKQYGLLHRLVKENIIPEQVPRIYVQMGKFYEKAARFNPGTVSSDTVDYKNALKYYERARVYQDSDDAQAKAHALYRKALVNAKLGNTTDAIEYYQELERVYSNTDYSVLAKIKLQDPADTGELAMTDSAMTVYRDRLGLEESTAVEAEQPVAEEAAPQQPAAQDDENLEGLIEQTKPGSAQDVPADTTADTPSVTPEEMPAETPEELPREEAPADTGATQPPTALPDTSGTF